MTQTGQGAYILCSLHKSNFYEEEQGFFSEAMWKTAWLTNSILPGAKPIVWLTRLQTFVVDLIGRQEKSHKQNTNRKLNL